MLEIGRNLAIPDGEIEIRAVRAGGPGGQNVNKVSSAIHLRFDVTRSSLPGHVKERIRRLRDRRLSSEGVIVIKAQRFRDQEKNRQDALQRLQAMVRKAMHRPKQRIPTRPGKAARARRVDDKTRRGRLKALRSKAREE